MRTEGEDDLFEFGVSLQILSFECAEPISVSEVPQNLIHIVIVNGVFKRIVVAAIFSGKRIVIAVADSLNIIDQCRITISQTLIDIKSQNMFGNREK